MCMVSMCITRIDSSWLVLVLENTMLDLAFVLAFYLHFHVQFLSYSLLMIFQFLTFLAFVKHMSVGSVKWILFFVCTAILESFPREQQSRKGCGG